MSNTTTIVIGDRKVTTLRDILPEEPGLRVLFVAKTPAPTSVEVGHYFQGKQGKMFWNRLKEYKLLDVTSEWEDDSLLGHGYGITDIVKVPRGYGDEPTIDEYRAGIDRILETIRVHKPRVVVFVYKGVLDRVLELAFDIRKKSEYGFNPDLDKHFGSRVFAFPMPGTPCRKEVAHRAMVELSRAV
jgi:mismatch-specific thymine-DNA glycosylase